MSARLGMLIPLLTVLALFGCSRKGSQEVVLIGHIAPFSGPDKMIGQHAKQALALAVKEANRDENRIDGRRIAVLHPNAETTALGPVAVRLVKVDRVKALLGGMDASQAQALSKAAQNDDVIVITPAVLLPQPANDNLFSVNTGLDWIAQVLARFTAEELKITQIAVLLDGRRQESSVLAAAFVKEFTKVSGNAVEEASYTTEPELVNQVERIKKGPPKGILLAGSPDDLVIMGKTGLEFPVLYAGGEFRGATLALNRKSATSVYLALAYVADADTPKNKAFVETYREQYQEAPDIHAALAYDGFQFLFGVLRQAKPEEKKVRDEVAALGKQAFESLTGSFLFDKNHSLQRTLYVVRFAGGQATTVKSYPPETK